MALQYSTIISIIYFLVNVVFMFGLALYVYKTGNHKLESRTSTYFKDIWNQRKIFFPLIIHFYDTATDIGVIYNWAELAKHEKDPTINYESIDMNTFFWCGVTFLLVYRVGILLFSLHQWYRYGAEWYYVILVLFDLYIFVVVYDSFNEAQGVITKNAARRAANRKRKQQKRKQALDIDKKLGTAIELGQISTNKVDNIKTALQDEVEVEAGEKQMYIQLSEAITESMPQIVLQSVFIIRSANDQTLSNGGSNIGLILFSVLASLFSISNKFVWWDKQSGAICDNAISLKPRQSFPNCIHYWYIICALWRLCHVLAKFAVFTLIWTVLGGVWLPIWLGVWFSFWSIIAWIYPTYETGFDRILLSSIITLGFLVAIFDPSKQYKLHFLYKWIETTMGMTVITLFMVFKFQCTICADSGMTNQRVLIYFILGIFAHLMDLMLYLALYFGNILMDVDDVIHHNRWSGPFGPTSTSEGDVVFKKLIDDYRTERITGIRLWTDRLHGSKVVTIEFQVNGIWRGEVGQSVVLLEKKELVLKDGEYFKQVSIETYTGLGYVKFLTNKENSLEAGITMPATFKHGLFKHVDLEGKTNFKLVDCKGKWNSFGIGALQFLFFKQGC